MNIALVAAVARNGVIGNGNRMPWHIPGELAIFRRLTEGKILLLGRKTFQSIGKILPDRITIVLTSDTTFHRCGVLTVTSIEEAIGLAAMADRDLMIGGGGEVYKMALPYCNRMHLTHIHRDYPGDTYFPQWNNEEWNEVVKTDVLASPCYHVSEYVRRPRA